MKVLSTAATRAYAPTVHVAVRGITGKVLSWGECLQAFNRDNECHGWLGVKMQPNPR